MIDLPRALLRGRYMKAAARIEHAGIPIDVDALTQLCRNWPVVKRKLIEHVDKAYGVYDGTTFKLDRFARWLTAQGLPWPRLPSGALALDDDTFKMMARAYPVVQPLRQLRDALAKLRNFSIPVGSDGRNRCVLWAFQSRTSRNQPKTSEFIFGAPAWLRGLIRPGPGEGLAYIDWSQQEIGIAAALSEDPAMIRAYESGDPYLDFAKQVGAVPSDATKASHGSVRDQYKACFLAVQYGMGAESLAAHIGQPVSLARELLLKHRETYRRLWAWSDAAVDYANLTGRLYTVFGWEIHLGPDSNSRFLRNFPMQANGAEMLRLACCLATEAGIRVCAPVHDAILIEAPLEELEASVARAQEAMAQASGIVLGGFRLRSEAKLVRYPERYQDDRGRDMWNTVWRLMSDLPTGATS
jgi:DNA polymerase-1